MFLDLLPVCAGMAPVLERSLLIVKFLQLTAH